MQKSEEIYDLIHSMDASEKRYFKRYSAIHSDKKSSVSIQIFDIVDKMKGYSEEKLRQHFKDQKTLRHLHVSKNYLVKNILRSLRSYHQSFSKESELKDILVEVELLSQKKQYALARKVLWKAHKTAYHYELFLQILEILQWISRIQFYEPSLPSQDFPPLEEELTKILEVFTWDAKLEAYWYQVIRHLRSPQQYKLPEISFPPEEHPVYQFVTTRSIIEFLRALLAQAEQKPSLAFEHLKQAEKIFLEKRELIAEKPTRYFLILSFQVDIALQLGLFPEALQTILNAKSIYESLKTHKIKALKDDFDSNFLFKLLYIYNSMGHFDRAVEYFENFLSKNSDYRSHFPEYMLFSIWTQVIYAYFGNGNYAKVFEYLEQIGKTSFENVEAYQPFVLWMYWLANHKLGDYQKVKDKLQWFFQWQYALEFPEFYTLIKKLTPWFTEQDKQSLESLRDFPLHLPELFNFDFTAWIESELQNQTMLDTLKKG